VPPRSSPGRWVAGLTTASWHRDRARGSRVHAPTAMPAPVSPGRTTRRCSSSRAWPRCRRRRGRL